MTAFSHPDEADEQIQKWNEMAQRRADAARQAVSRMETFSADAWSPRREVRVALNSSGLVADVEFAEWAPNESPLSLARAFQRAHDDAILRWQEEMDTIADEEYAEFDAAVTCIE